MSIVFRHICQGRVEHSQRGGPRVHTLVVLGELQGGSEPHQNYIMQTTAQRNSLCWEMCRCIVRYLLSSHLVLITRAHSLLEAESMHFTIQSHHFFLKPTTEHNVMCRIEGNKSTVWSNKMQDGAVSTRLPVDEFKHFMSSIHTLAPTVLRFYVDIVLKTDPNFIFVIVISKNRYCLWSEVWLRVPMKKNHSKIIFS